MKQQTKMIRILTAGPLWALGGCYGPILNEYSETIPTILQLIKDGVTVVERLKDGTEIPLTLMNYDKVNTNGVDEPEVVNEVVEELKKEEIPEPPKEQPQQNQGGKKDKKKQESELKADELEEKK